MWEGWGKFWLIRATEIGRGIGVCVRVPVMATWTVFCTLKIEGVFSCKTSAKSLIKEGQTSLKRPPELKTVRKVVYKDMKNISNWNVYWNWSTCWRQKRIWLNYFQTLRAFCTRGMLGSVQVRNIILLSPIRGCKILNITGCNFIFIYVRVKMTVVLNGEHWMRVKNSVDWDVKPRVTSESTKIQPLAQRCSQIFIHFWRS
jgi:hypothetical protein